MFCVTRLIRAFILPICAISLTACGEGSLLQATSERPPLKPKACASPMAGTSEAQALTMAALYGRRLALYEDECRKGSGTACYLAASAKARGGHGTAAMADMQEACDFGNGAACANVGLFKMRQTDGEHARPEAKALFEQACNMHSAAGCFSLAAYYHASDSPDRDEEKSTMFSAKACDLGLKQACAPSDDTQGSKRELHAPIASAEIRRFCSGRDPFGCAVLGQYFLRGEYLPKDERKAREYLEKSCTLKNGYGCALLGSLYAKSSGPYPKPRRAVSAAARGCGLASPEACALTGIFLHQGIGAHADEGKARRFFEKACELKNPEGCVSLGLLYESGTDTAPRDVQKATSYYERACNEGAKVGCMLLKDAEEKK